MMVGNHENHPELVRRSGSKLDKKRSWYRCFFGTVFESDPNGVARFRWVDPRSKTMFLGARSHCGMVIACKWAGCLSQFSGTLELGRLRSHNS